MVFTRGEWSLIDSTQDSWGNLKENRRKAEGKTWILCLFTFCLVSSEKVLCFLCFMSFSLLFVTRFPHCFQRKSKRMKKFLEENVINVWWGDVYLSHRRKVLLKESKWAVVHLNHFRSIFSCMSHTQGLCFDLLPLKLSFPKIESIEFSSLMPFLMKREAWERIQPKRPLHEVSLVLQSSFHCVVVGTQFIEWTTPEVAAGDIKEKICNEKSIFLNTNLVKDEKEAGLKKVNEHLISCFSHLSFCSCHVMCMS